MDKKLVPQMELLRRRIQVVGVPREIWNPVLDLFEKWVRSSGLEWAIARFKSAKVDLLRTHAGLNKTAPWFAHRRTGELKGPLGGLEAYSHRSGYALSRAIALINLYTTFTFDGPTKAQSTKFLDGVYAENTPLDPLIASCVINGAEMSGLIPRQGRLRPPSPLLTYMPIPRKRAPTPSGSMDEAKGVLGGLQYLTLGRGPKHVLDFWELYKPVLTCLDPYSEVISQEYHLHGLRSSRLNKFDGLPLYVGRIGLIQEAGGKLRAVANPARVYQRVLEPLGDFLFGTLRKLPWDCTFDQSKADSLIQERLAAGGRVHSVDLTGATDYFPLDLQMVALKWLLPHESSVKAFEEISKGLWECTLPQDVLSSYTSSRYIQWRKGQPLGLYPSFASFALTHGLLLLGLLGRPWSGQFFVLGDDVVILDDLLHERYLEAMSSMGCPVSTSKSLSSTKIAEFRSVIYLADRKINQFKWRKISDESFLDLLRSDPRLYPLLTSRQRAIVDIVAALPSELGGLGWNPKGLPLVDRLRGFEDFIMHEDSPLSLVTGLNSHARSLMNASSWKLSHGQVAFPPLDFDQKSKELVRQFLSVSLEPLYEILGSNLDAVVDIPVDLPVRVSRHQTVLQRLERVLRRHLKVSSDLHPSLPTTA